MTPLSTKIPKTLLQLLNVSRVKPPNQDWIHFNAGTHPSDSKPLDLFVTWPRRLCYGTVFIYLFRVTPQRQKHRRKGRGRIQSRKIYSPGAGWCCVTMTVEELCHTLLILQNTIV
ncbi:unnamed protein product [Ixodes pacificus]